jgi:hypothetical protein
MPATSLRVIQLSGAGEGTYGTIKVATAKLMGLTDASVGIVNESRVIEQLGNLGPSSLASLDAQSGVASVQAVASYEDILYFTQALFGAATTAGTAAPYTFTHVAPTTAAPTIVGQSLEYGTTGAAYVLTGAIAQSLKIRGVSGELWTMQADWLGKAVSTVSLAALADRTVNVIRMADTTFAVDTWGGTMGATAAAATLISFDLALETGRHLKTFAGAANPSSWGEGRMNGTLTTVLEFNATAKAYVDALIGPLLTQRQIQIKASQGATTTTKSATIQFAGTLVDNVTLFANRDGNIIVSLTWRGTYLAGLTSWMKYIGETALTVLV